MKSPFAPNMLGSSVVLVCAYAFQYQHLWVDEACSLALYLHSGLHYTGSCEKLSCEKMENVSVKLASLQQPCMNCIFFKDYNLGC